MKQYYKSQERLFDESLVKLREQIERTKMNVDNTVNKFMDDTKAYTLPDEISELLNLQLDQYYKESEKVIGSEARTIAKYNIIQVDTIDVAPDPPEFDHDDNGYELFHEAVQVTDTLCNMLQHEMDNRNI